MEELALFGGKPLVDDHSSLRISWPVVSENSKRALYDAIDNKDFSGRGSVSVLDLEKLYSEKYNKHATCLSNATAAIHAALYALDIGPGDEVIVPNFTFVATAMAVLHVMAIPVFADIDPITFNIDPVDVTKRITSRTKAIIVVHMQGMPADMDQLVDICKKYNLKLIEDVAQAPGATYKGQEVGTFGDASAFSLMSQKNIGTCGECGILLLSDLDAKNKAEKLRIYGEIISPDMPRAYSSYSLGWNYTAGPLEAAMATEQTKEYPTLLSQIQTKARSLNELLRRYDWVIPPIEAPDRTSAFHFFRVRLISPDQNVSSGRFRRAIQEALNAEGLLVRHYQNVPVSEQVVFKEKKAFGRGLPWSLNEGTTYDFPVSSYPNTLDMLETTLVLGAIGSAPSYFLCDGTIEKYAAGFEKLNRRLLKLLKYALELDYRRPWEEIPKTSDSFRAIYK